MRTWTRGRAQRALRAVAVSGVLVLGTGVVSAAAVDPGESGAVATVVPGEPGVDGGAGSATGQEPVGETPTGQEPSIESRTDEGPVTDPVAGTPQEVPVDGTAPTEATPDAAAPEEQAPSEEQVPSEEPAPDGAADPGVEGATDDAAEAAPAVDPVVEPAAVQAEPVTLDLVVSATDFVTIDYRTPLLGVVPDLTTATPTLASNPREGVVHVYEDQVHFTAAKTVTVPEVSFVLLVDVDGVTYPVQVNLVVLIEPVAEDLIGYTSLENPASLYYWAGAEWYDLYEDAYYELEPRVISVDPVDPAVATVSISHEGQMIDVVQNANTTGRIELGYTVEDGLGRQARGILRVEQLPQFADTQVTLSTSQDNTVQIDAVSLIGASPEHAYAYPTGYDPELGIFPSREGGRVRGLPGAKSVSYTPAAGFTGTDYLEIEVYDASGRVQSLGVTVEVASVVVIGPGLQIGPEVKTGTDVKTVRLATTGSTPGVGALAAGGAVLTGGGC